MCDMTRMSLTACMINKSSKLSCKICQVHMRLKTRVGFKSDTTAENTRVRPQSCTLDFPLRSIKRLHNTLGPHVRTPMATQA